MTIWLHVFRFYINSSIHVALAVVALGVATALSMGFELDVQLLALLFFGSISGYNFVKYAGVAGLHHRSLTPGLKVIQVFSLMCGIAMLLLLFKMPQEVLFWGVCFGLLTGFYAVPLFSRKRNLRSLKGVKIFVIAAVWTGVTVVLPIIKSGVSVSWDVYMMMAQRFLFVIVITLPFEIRDLKYDASSLNTLPQVVGIQGVKYLGLSLLVLVVIFEYFKDEIHAAQLLSTVGIVCIAGIVLLKTKEEQSHYFASFWVESLSMLWMCFILGSQLLLT